MNRPIIPDTLADALKPITLENKTRANIAYSALLHHKSHTCETLELGPVIREDVIDLVTNLKHACDHAGYDWDAINEISTTHYLEEQL